MLPNHVVHFTQGAGRAENKPDDQTRSIQEMAAREWGHHETHIMEKAQGFISELCSQSESKELHFNDEKDKSSWK